MKTIRNTCIAFIMTLLMMNISIAQQKFQVHQDNVKPSMFMQYEKIAKEFNEASVKHNLQATWFTASTNDFKYFYVTPIENFAELDERPYADMAEAMGDDFTKMFEEFNKCYDSHGTYIIVRDSELSYMPEGVEDAPVDENYRKWYYMYYTPENAKNVREGMKAVKEMFKTKGSKQYYRVYRNGLGQMENYYMVSVAAKNEIDSAQRDEANKAVLGPERIDTFDKLLKYISRMEEFSGEMRPDLDYAPKKE